MRSRGGQPVHEQELSAALHRFPQVEFAVRKLLAGSEDFRELCRDLAEAEAALANVAALVPEELREARKAEWQDLVDRLVAEIGTVLSESEAWRNRPDRRRS